jgi:hypothetical protein
MSPLAWASGVRVNLQAPVTRSRTQIFQVAVHVALTQIVYVRNRNRGRPPVALIAIPTSRIESLRRRPAHDAVCLAARCSTCTGGETGSRIAALIHHAAILLPFCV